MKSAQRWAVRGIALVVVALVTAGGFAWHQGYRIYILHTGSMSPTLRPGDAVLDGPAPASVHPGEVVTFTVHSGPDSVVTHRVASFSNGIVHTKGDANRTVDPWTLHLSQVVGTAVAFLPKIGYALVYLKQPAGVASIVTVLFGLVLLWQVFFPAEPTPVGAVAEEEGSAARPAGRRGLVPQARHRRGPSRRLGGLAARRHLAPRRTPPLAD